MRVSDFKISTRLGAAFGILVVVTLLLGLLSMVQLSQVAGTTERLATVSMPGIQLTGELREHLNDMRRAEARHLLSSARKEMKALEAQIAESRKKLEALDAVAARMFASPEAAKSLRAYQSHRAAYYAANDLMAPASRAGKQDEATNIYNGDSNTAFEGALAAVIQLSRYSATEATASWERASATYELARLWVVGGMGAAVLLAAALAVLIARSIARPIRTAVQAAIVTTSSASPSGGRPWLELLHWPREGRVATLTPASGSRRARSCPRHGRRGGRTRATGHGRRPGSRPGSR